MTDKPLDTEAIAQLEEHPERYGGLSLEERGEWIVAACRAAAEIERGRLASGLPPSQPAPWPKSTWDFLRRHAGHGEQSRADP